MLSRYHLQKRKERTQQFLRARTSVSKGERSVHIITVYKKGYLKAAIRCVNSIWFHSPEMNVVIHIDDHLFHYRNYLLQRMDRRDRVRIQKEETFTSWQELKLKVILNDLGENDAFSDADLYWNVPIPDTNTGLYFSAEAGVLNQYPYCEVIQDSGIEIMSNSFMANSSYIALGKIANKVKFANEEGINFQRIRDQVEKNNYDEKVRLKILRLSEQIALSISINERSSYFKSLKVTDKPMDGGAAESYYLGTTKGWA